MLALNEFSNNRLVPKQREIQWKKSTERTVSTLASDHEQPYLLPLHKIISLPLKLSEELLQGYISIFLSSFYLWNIFYNVQGTIYGVQTFFSMRQENFGIVSYASSRDLSATSKKHAIKQFDEVALLQKDCYEKEFVAILSGLSSKVARKSNDKISLSLRLPIDHVVVQTFYVYSYCLSQSKLHDRPFVLRIPASKIIALLTSRSSIVAMIGNGQPNVAETRTASHGF